MGDAVGDGTVAREHGFGELVALAMMLERHRDRADAAVDLGQCYMHGEVARPQPARSGTPCSLGCAGEDGLEDGRIGAGQRIDAGRPIDTTHGEGGGVEQNVGPQPGDGLVE